MAKHPMFSRRHYVAIAGALEKANAPFATIFEVMKVFERDNPAFDQMRFLDCSNGWGKDTTAIRKSETSHKERRT